MPKGFCAKMGNKVSGIAKIIIDSLIILYMLNSSFVLSSNVK